MDENKDGIEFLDASQIMRKNAEEKLLEYEYERSGNLSQEETAILLHELRVHQIELEMQNDELQRLHLEEKKMRARYFNLYDLAPVGYFTIGKNGLITEGNLTAAQMLGVSRKFLLSKSLSLFVFDEDQDLYYLHHRRLFTTAEPQFCEVRMMNQNNPFWVKLESTLTNDSESGSICWSVIMDITAAKNNEITLVRNEEKLNSINKRYQLATEIGNIGIWEWNLSTNKITWNDEMFRIYCMENSNKDTVTYSEWKNSIYHEDTRIAENLINKTMINKTRTSSDFRIESFERKIKYIHTVQDVILDENENILQVIGVNIDMTEVKELEKKLKEERCVAEKANKAKSEFLANISHEIRTPLNGVIGFTELLKDIESEPQKIEFIDIISSSSKHLLAVINDVLSLSKIEAGKMELHKHSVDFYKLIKNSENIFLQQAKIHELEFYLEYDSTIPPVLIVDETPLMQILTNLIGNSIKFSNNGEIRLSITDITPEEKNNKIIEFRVKDNGIGINKEKQERLYEPFEQGEYYLTKTYGGTGLGLAIVKSLITLMKGEIEVKTEIGKGTEFIFRIPLECAEESYEPAKEIPELNIDGDLRVISAEDNSMNQVLIERISIREGWFLKKVSNGKELLEELEKSEYDIVLLDIQMPVLNGLDAVKLIRSNKKNSLLPIIGISAFAMDEEIEMFLETGINAFIAKPFSPRELKEKIFFCLQE